MWAMNLDAALSGEIGGRRQSVSWLRCHARPVILILLGLTIAGVFWFASRYPALLAKAHQTGHVLPSMAYNHEAFPVAATDAIWTRISYGTLNWLDSMRVGMSFGILFGALLHTALRYYPLRIGQNYALNSLKGALIGAPMGVCVNCGVPMACGITRGHGRVEVALGYLFSSPTFNPVVVAMTFLFLPWYFGFAKYVLVCFVILVLVPRLIGYLESRRAVTPFTVDASVSGACTLTSDPCDIPFSQTLIEIAKDYATHLWMLLKPTIALMLIASVVSSALLVLVPWPTLLGNVNFFYMAVAAVLSVLMPIPIALDVMFAAQLYQQGVNPGYAMLFLTTLGTYSIIPAVYLWREVSHKLAIYLFAFFVAAGFALGLLFAALA